MKRHHLPESFGPPASGRPGSGRPTVDVVPVLSVRPTTPRKPPALRDPPPRDVYLRMRLAAELRAVMDGGLK